jgi:hypothetical protein
MFDVSPSRLMTPAELRTARALFRKQRRLTAGRSKSASIDELERLQMQLASLAENVLRRDLGLYRYMVIEVRRSDRSKKLQVLEFDVDLTLPEQWRLSGRNVKANGTLGAQRVSAVLWYGTVFRRELTGEWTPLMPRKRQKV